MNPVRLITGIILICISSFSLAQEVSEEFLQAYRSYDAAYSSNDFERATEFARQALDLAIKEIGPDHEKTAVLMINLGHLLIYRNAEDEGSKLLLDAEKIITSTEGPDNEALITVYEDMALVYAGKGELTNARDQFNKAMGIREKAYGTDDPGIVYILTSLAQLDTAENKLDSAAEHYLKAIDIIENSSGSDDPAAVSLKVSLGDLAILNNKPADAERLYLEALDLFHKKLPESDSRVLNVHGRLGELYVSQGSDQFSIHADKIATLAKTEDGPAQPLFIIEPDLSPDIRQVNGTVLIEFTVTAEGRVLDPRIIESNPLKIFDQAVLDISSTWRFLPRTMEGKKIEQKNTRARVIIQENEVEVHLGEIG